MRTARALSAATFAALTMALVAQPWTAAAVPEAAAPSAGQDLTQLQQQVTAQQQTLNQLDNDVKLAEGVVDLTSRQLDSDQTQEAQVLKQMQGVARIEYQRPALSLSEILQARNLDQLISRVAQTSARLPQP